MNVSLVTRFAGHVGAAFRFSPIVEMICWMRFLLGSILLVGGTAYPDILFIISTQPGAHHTALATRTEEFLLSQYQHVVPDIFWSSRDLHHPASASAWAVFPLGKAWSE